MSIEHVIGALIVMMLANQIVMRMPSLVLKQAPYLLLQACNASLVLGLVIFGLPGLDAWPAAAWMLALMWLFRIVQNHYHRMQMISASRVDEGAEERTAALRRKMLMEADGQVDEDA